MRSTLLFILLVAFLGLGDEDNKVNKINRIAKTNKLKKEASIAFENKDFEKAIKKYRFLLDTLEVDDENIRLNLAHCYFQINDTTYTEDTYKQALVNSTNKKNRSISYQQLGILSQQKGQKEQALNYFKQALKENPYNEEARYNYELLKKWKDDEQKKKQDKKDQNKKQDQKKDQKDKKNDQNKEKEKQEQDKKSKEEQKKKENEQKKDKQDQQKQNQQDKKEGKKDQDDQKDESGKQKDKSEEKGKEKNEDKKGEGEKDEKKKGEEEKKEGKKGEQKKEDEQKEGQGMSQEQKKALEEKKRKEQMAQRFKEMKISEEKAKMILNAMNNKEKQYFQQLRKKSGKRIDSNKPDW